MELTERTLHRLQRDFKASELDRARYIIESVDIGGHDETQGSERIQVAMLILAGRNLDRLLEAAVLTETDWRDLLVDADLADDDWRPKVDAYLAP